MHTATARPRPAPKSDARARAATNDEFFGALLTRAQIGGRLSLVDRRPLEIAAERGLIVRVATGSVWSGQSSDPQYRLVSAGECFVADRAGSLTVRTLDRGEIEIDWPPLAAERLSPGLEPISLVP
jgi:hypothetical protein